MQPMLWIAVPVLGWTCWLARRYAERREALTCHPPGEMLDIGGRRLHVRRTGAGGPSVVIESGGAFSSVMWWPLQDRLAATTTVVTYDRAGLGWSDPAPLPRSIEQRADELHTMLERAKIPPPYLLVGLSYGGPLIRAFAARHRQLVAGFVFVDIAHEAVFGTPGAQTYLRRCSRALRVIAMLAAMGVPRLLRMRGIPDAATALPYTQAQQAVLRSRFPPAHSFRAGADEFASMLRIDDAMQGLGAAGLFNGIPVVVVSHGKPFPGPFAVLETNHLQGQQALANMSDHGELAIAMHSSHAIPLEEPGLLLDAICRAVAAVRGAQRAQ